MLIYDNEYETKENKNWTKDKIQLQLYTVQQVFSAHGCESLITK